jgi:hypothetical protein
VSARDIDGVGDRLEIGRVVDEKFAPAHPCETDILKLHQRPGVDKPEMRRHEPGEFWEAVQIPLHDDRPELDGGSSAQEERK